MAAPAVEQGVIGRERQPPSEGLDRFAVLARAGLGDPQLDDEVNIPRIAGEGAFGPGDRPRVALRAILHAGWRAVLHRLPGDWAGGRSGCEVYGQHPSISNRPTPVVISP